MLLAPVLAIAVLASAQPAPAAEDRRPRLVVSSDFPPVDAIPGGLPEGPPEKRSDRDDLQSMVRFLVHVNEFRVEGLVAASGTLANVARKQNLLDMLAIYDRVDDNLRRHDPRFPTATALRAITWEGLSGAIGKPAPQILGEGKDSEASRQLERLLQKPAADGSPLWFCAWGGSQELAQALLRLRERAPDDLPRILAALRVFLIDDQDGSGPWLRREFPRLFIIKSKTTFPGLAYLARGTERQLGDRIWVDANLRKGHGPLGAAYPESGFIPEKLGVMEGDTPSFLHLLVGSLGLGDPEHPEWGGWGGRYVRVDPAVPHFFDASEGPQSVTKFQARIQAEFAARMDWTVRGARAANHPPVVSLNGVVGTAPLVIDAAPGSEIKLSAEGSRDPDGGIVTYHWWSYAEPGGGDVKLTNSGQPTTTITIPPDASGERHVVLEVSDAGDPRLVRYRRIVIRCKRP